jgi:hypothetical protein
MCAFAIPCTPLSAKRMLLLPVMKLIVGCHARHCAISLFLHVCFVGYTQASKSRYRSEEACMGMLSDVQTLV